jgi:hypothetical protein
MGRTETMTCAISERLCNEVMEGVNEAKMRDGLVNITALVDAIDPHYVVGAMRKELEEIVLNLAIQSGCAIEFGKSSEIHVVPEGYTVLEIEILPDSAVRI